VQRRTFAEQTCPLSLKIYEISMTYIIYPNLGQYLFSSWAAVVQKMNIKDCTLTKIALLKLIRRLPNAAPVTDRSWPTDHHPNKEHWIGWLEEYDGPGYYNRRHPSAHRDAAFVYNHLHCPPMLSWVAEHAQVPAKVLREACTAAGPEFNKPRGAAAFRKSCHG
jgi:hypothetical protein